MKLVIAWIICSLLFLPLCSLYSHDVVHSRSIGLIINSYFIGEREFAERIKIASERLHWKAEIIDLSSFKNLDNHYDWILTLVPGKECISGTNDYLFLTVPEHHYFESNGHLNEKYRNYTGYLATYKNTDLLREDAKNTYPKRWYPTVQYRPYQQVTPTRLFAFLGHWGDRFAKERYQTLQKELSKKSYTNFFGLPHIGKFYGKAFKGNINFDGQSIMECISEMGVCLVLHSETHLKHETPSGRIFEAAAASAVIISDQNPFVVEHFGDSVLYVNQELSGDEMFEQIDAHMTWIQNNPEEALEMAQRAHQIFEDNFLLESQLLDFDKFHSETVSKAPN